MMANLSISPLCTFGVICVANIPLEKSVKCKVEYGWQHSHQLYACTLDITVSYYTITYLNVRNLFNVEPPPNGLHYLQKLSIMYVLHSVN